MEKLTAELMLHPAAADFTATIPADADPAALADTYRKLITHTDYYSHAACLGIEYHLRTHAIYNPMGAGARALAEIEAALQAPDSARGRRRKRATAHRAILRKGPTR